MIRFAPLFRLAGAACALVLALALFQAPLRQISPAVEDVMTTLPGMGASRGFVMQVLSTPSGAEIRIDSQPRGTTPFFGNVTCRDGQEVAIEVIGEGRPPWRRVVPCREGGTLRVTARLDR